MNSPPYHDPFNVNIPPDYRDLLAAGVPPDTAAAILDHFDETTFTAIPCGDGYAYFANPPWCGADHYRAVAEVLRAQYEGRAVRPRRREPARTVTEARAAPRLDATSAKPRRQRRPSIATLIERAEKTGKRVTSITTPDGTVIHFDETMPSDEGNPWLADLPKVKQ